MTRPARPARALFLIAALLGTAAAGCEATRRQAARKEPAPTYSVPELGSVEGDPSFERPEELRGFFKSNRSAGALSSEARAIEQSLLR